MRRFDSSSLDFAAAFAAFLAEPRGSPAEVDGAVAAVIAAVRAEGVGAVLRFTRQFDGVELAESDLRVTPEEIEAGATACPEEVTAAIAFAAGRIRAYHARQMPADAAFVDGAGVELGWRWRPLASVGVYVPGGRAAYPSTVLMNAVPAQVAGVGRIAMASPPGRLDPAVLAAAKEAGVAEIWRVGGAQAIAALACGARPIAPVDKIVGPGNAFVTAAKRQVHGMVGIDSLAGPSEIVVVADAHCDPAWIAADLLAQAEHDPDAQSILITDDRPFANAVEALVAEQLAGLATGDVAAASWARHGAIVIAPLEAAAVIIDQIAPEHVELAVADPSPLAREVRHAGAIFVGRRTPEAIGDYVAGTNHVLPTSGAARFSSGLSVLDFLKRTSIVGCDEAAFRTLAGPTMALAWAEGRPAHARSVSLRLEGGE
ncbi:MAG: histidinol dehydrogenase [Caulobacteraceae bacterium]